MALILRVPDMNLPKSLALVTLTALSLCSVHSFADSTSTVQLPVMKVMAERELREETGVIAYQQDPVKRKALQQRVMKLERDVVEHGVNGEYVGSIEMLAPEPKPNLDSLPLWQQQYVQSIANGLQSSKPTDGLYIMLKPFGIDRNATNVQISRDQISLGTLDRALFPSNGR